MYSYHSLRTLLMGLLLTSFPVSVNGKRLDNEGKAPTAIKSTVDALSRSFFQSAKRNNGSGLPPRVQLTIVIPSTSTVGARNFLLLKTFVQRLVQEFSVSPSGTRVAMVTHSSASRLVFNWHQFMNIECTLKGISSVRFTTGKRSSLDHMLNFVKTSLYSPLKRENPDVHRIVFIIAESSLLNSAVPNALPPKTLKDNGAEVFILAVGNRVTIHEPNRVASKPFKTHMFRVSSYGDLSRLSKAFRGKGFNHSCSGVGIVYDECNRRCRCKNGKPIDCYRIRKDFTEMSFDERCLYVRAFKTVSMEAPYKRKYDFLTKLHPKFFDVIHEKVLFFPWHRWYLSVFENLLRHFDCRVTVPYWNWARAVSSKRLWRQTYIRDIWNPGPHGLGGNGDFQSGCVRSGPFRQGKWSLPTWLNSNCLSREFDHKMLLPGEWFVKDLNKIPFNNFNKFESGVREFMHNDLHNAIGGTMSQDESAVAPEFWFHHAFLDKIWSNWQDKGSKYKFAYFRSINKTLPGGTHFGWEFMDLQNQPHCLRVLYEESSEEEIPVGTEEQRAHHGYYGPEYDEGKDDDDDDHNDNNDDDNDDDDDDDDDDDGDNDDDDDGSKDKHDEQDVS